MGKRTIAVPAAGSGVLGALLAGGALLATILCATRAEAIPAFSREYKTECTTCHTIFPQLNEFGEAFEKNGLIWPGAAKKVKRVAQTEEERRSAEYISLAGIPAQLPISALMSVSYLYNEEAEDDFDMKRYSAEIFGAGALGGDKFGFWFNESLGSQSGAPTGPSQVWFVARHPFGVPAHVKAGRFSPDVSIWRTTLNGRLLSIGSSVGGFSVTSAQSGLEVSSFLGPRVIAVVGMKDRNNSSESKAPHSVGEYYGRVGVKIGGADYLGQEPEVDLEKDSVWDYLSVQLSAFGYSGSTSTGDGVDHDLNRLGAEAGVLYKKWQLMLGATVGENNADDDDPIDSTGLSAEVDYVFNPKFAAALRYDYLDVDGKDKREVITPCVIYAPLQSFKLRLSAANDSNTNNAAPGKANKNTTATLTAQISF